MPVGHRHLGRWRGHRHALHTRPNRTFQIQPDQHTFQRSDTRHRVLKPSRMSSDGFEEDGHTVPTLLRSLLLVLLVVLRCVAIVRRLIYSGRLRSRKGMGQLVHRRGGCRGRRYGVCCHWGRGGTRRIFVSFGMRFFLLDSGFAAPPREGKIC